MAKKPKSGKGYLADLLPQLGTFTSHIADAIGQGRGLAYYRVSDRSQVDTDYDPEGNSLPTQRKTVRELAESLNITLVEEYVEPGKSALPLDQRPKFAQMVKRIIEHRDIKYVLVYSLSRLARNRYEDAIVGLTLERLGVTVISVKEHLHGNDPATRAMRGMLAVFNQFQVESSGEDIKTKLANKASNGGTPGLAKIGYVNIAIQFEGRKVNTVELDPQRAEYIPQIFDLADTGRYTPTQIHEIITERGFRNRPRKGAPLQPVKLDVILKILRDRYYCGYITHDGIEYKGRHQALVSEEQFNRVQRILDSSGIGGTRRTVHYHPLKGLLWCQRCRRRFVLSNNTGNGGTYTYVFCMGRKHKVCDQPFLRMDTLTGVEHAVSAHFESVTIAEEIRAVVTAAAATALAAAGSGSDTIREKLTTELAKLDNTEDALLDLAGDDEWNRDKLTAKLKTIRARQAGINRQLDELDTNPTTGHELLNQALALLVRARQLYDTGTPEIQNLITRTMFTRLYLDADEVTAVAVTNSELAEPFDTATELADAAHAAASLTGPADNPAPGYELPSPRQNPDTQRSGPLPKERTASPIDLRQVVPAPACVTGLNTPRLVGTTGFEPATP
ncbi:recombinase family protein [Crossiella sp. SN42]|uniref:recombinase family protein n=1 Tax=Crossiella sp. SN42 TaxID=2944808 RepID=UPI00207CA5C7|nr:recombinase family protein [Crossiella sp. SN42]MCO1579160.1 recombinase family protein [Crossiella sp. SN42]